MHESKRCGYCNGFAPELENCLGWNVSQTIGHKKHPPNHGWVLTTDLAGAKSYNRQIKPTLINNA